MTRRMAVLAAIFTASCSDSANYYGEEWSPYYEHPREETSRKRVDSKEIVYWATNPKDKKRIGFYETWEVKLKGSRQTRECHYIKDSGGLTIIGFVSNEGVFYRFEPGSSTPRKIDEYQILSTGLKVFFGIPIRENVDLEDIDPYRVANPPAGTREPAAAPAPPAPPAEKPDKK
jgi:hypothetical protein